MRWCIPLINDKPLRKVSVVEDVGWWVIDGVRQRCQEWLDDPKNKHGLGRDVIRMRLQSLRRRGVPATSDEVFRALRKTSANSRRGWWEVEGEIQRREDWVADPRNVSGLGIRGLKGRLERARRDGRRITIDELMRRNG